MIKDSIMMLAKLYKDGNATYENIFSYLSLIKPYI